jgi:hypothetical protein
LTITFNQYFIYKMSALQLADWMNELGQVVYNRLKSKHILITNADDKNDIPDDMLDTLDQENTIEFFEDYLNNHMTDCRHFTFEFSESDAYKGSGKLLYHRGIGRGKFALDILLTTTIKHEFVRVKGEYAQVFKSSQNKNSILSKLQVGDFIVEDNGERGLNSKIVNGKKQLEAACDDSGYTECPQHISDLIENPIEFYSKIPNFLRVSWGMTGVWLNIRKHKHVIKKLGLSKQDIERSLGIEKESYFWYDIKP